MDFDQNQEFGHFGKVTPPWPPQRGRVPEMPTVVRFGAENPLFSGEKLLPNVGIFRIFRKISRIRLKMTHVYEYGFIFCENLSH